MSTPPSTAMPAPSSPSTKATFYCLTCSTELPLSVQHAHTSTGTTCPLCHARLHAHSLRAHLEAHSSDGLMITDAALQEEEDGVAYEQGHGEEDELAFSERFYCIACADEFPLEEQEWHLGAETKGCAVCGWRMHVEWLEGHMQWHAEAEAEAEEEVVEEEEEAEEAEEDWPVQVDSVPWVSKATPATPTPVGSTQPPPPQSPSSTPPQGWCETCRVYFPAYSKPFHLLSSQHLAVTAAQSREPKKPRNKVEKETCIVCDKKYNAAGRANHENSKRHRTAASRTTPAPNTTRAAQGPGLGTTGTGKNKDEMGNATKATGARIGVEEARRRAIAAMAAAEERRKARTPKSTESEAAGWKRRAAAMEADRSKAAKAAKAAASASRSAGTQPAPAKEVKEKKKHERTYCDECKKWFHGDGYAGHLPGKKHRAQAAAAAAAEEEKRKKAAAAAAEKEERRKAAAAAAEKEERRKAAAAAAGVEEGRRKAAMAAAAAEKESAKTWCAQCAKWFIPAGYAGHLGGKSHMKAVAEAVDAAKVREKAAAAAAAAEVKVKVGGSMGDGEKSWSLEDIRIPIHAAPSTGGVSLLPNPIPTPARTPTPVSTPRPPQFLCLACTTYYYPTPSTTTHHQLPPWTCTLCAVTVHTTDKSAHRASGAHLTAAMRVAGKRKAQMTALRTSGVFWCAVCRRAVKSTLGRWHTGVPWTCKCAVVVHVEWAEAHMQGAHGEVEIEIEVEVGREEGRERRASL